MKAKTELAICSLVVMVATHFIGANVTNKLKEEAIRESAEGNLHMLRFVTAAWAGDSLAKEQTAKDTNEKRLVEIANEIIAESKTTKYKLLKSLDVIIFDSNKNMVNNPRYFYGNSKLHLDGAQYNLAIAGQKGELLSKDYRTTDVLSSYGSFGNKQQRYGISIEIDKNDIDDMTVYPIGYVGKAIIVLCTLYLIWYIFSIQTNVENNKYFAPMKLFRMFPDGGCVFLDNDGLILECNTNFAKMLGHSFTSDVIGRNIDTIVQQVDHKAKRLSFTQDIAEREVKVHYGDREISIYLSVTKIDTGFFARIRERTNGTL